MRDVDILRQLYFVGSAVRSQLGTPVASPRALAVDCLPWVLYRLRVGRGLQSLYFARGMLSRLNTYQGPVTVPIRVQLYVLHLSNRC